MKRGWLLILSLSIIQGCGSSAPQTAPIVQDPDAPRTVTDLSSISAAPLSQFNKQTEAGLDEASSAAARETFARGAQTTRRSGDDKHPDDERLLNMKASEFSDMSSQMLDQVVTAVNQLEDEDEISHLKLPTQLKAVILTATLDRSGKLKELVIEQHSGQAAVDRTFVKACKTGLYVHNPPHEAATPDGTYKMRVEGRMENWASPDGERWEFKTYVGLALL